MPKSKGEHPYEILCRETRRLTRARAVLLHVDEGMFGTNWAVDAPPEVAALLPELLDDVADELMAAKATADAAVVVKPIELDKRYGDMTERACRLTNARYTFLYVMDGIYGTAHDIFAPPEIAIEPIAEMVRHIGEVLKGDEFARRVEIGLERFN